MKPAHVAVIGGGYSGTLQAIQLVRHGLQVTLIERTEQVGLGVAYGTPHADHLLNVRAGGMSAFADQPNHFANWFGDADGFAERRLYGAYLQELLASAANQAGDRLRMTRGEAIDIRTNPEGECILLEGGAVIEADAAVLSVGNLVPAPLRMIAAGLADGAHYVADPWVGDFTSGLSEDDAVLLIGTGLTAVDAALMLDSAGFEGRILALSRRGLVPRAHGEAVPLPKLEALPPPHCTALVRHLRRQVGRIGWRAAIDQLRPVTHRLWASAQTAERRRFLRHLRPYWDVHRHRIAPSIALRIKEMVGEGRLQFAAGRIISVSTSGDGAAIEWKPRGRNASRTLIAARILNCTGPESDISRVSEPLLRNLIAAGRIRPDVCRIGIDIDSDSRVLDADGQASRTLYAVGPMTRGAWWEIVAVPDIRGQVASLARQLAA